MRVLQEHVTHPDQAFRWLRFEAGAEDGGRHRHRQLELTWIERGQGLRVVGDSAQPFDDGDLVLLGSNLPHAWIRGQPRPDRMLRATVIQFAPELLRHPLMPELAALQPLAQSAERGLRIEGAAWERVTTLLQAMSEAGAIDRLAGLMAILATLLAHPADLQPIASRPLRERAADGAPGGAPHAAASALHEPTAERRIDRVIDWIHQHLSHELAVADAARLAHVTPAAFSRYFKREVGKSFVQYVNDVRCSEACLRLRGSDRPVARIAQECGFATMSHFNAQFLKRTGQTPRQFRRALV